ncbi:MAG: hypothetical protein ACK2TV_00580, partial [Anaerolineales bacterium]
MIKNRIVYGLIFSILIILMGCREQNSQSVPESHLTDDQAARETLLSFLDSLHNGKYVQAVALYGGTYESMIDQNPGLSPDDHTALFRDACTKNGMQCLQVQDVTLEKKISKVEFLFAVTFLQEDGT